MRIAIEVNMLLGPRTGIGWYTYELLRGLVDVAPGHEYYAVFRSPLVLGARGVRALGLPNHPSVRPTPYPPGAYRLWKWLGTSLVDRKVECRVYHGTNYFPLPSNRHGRVLTVHDLAAYRFPQYVTPHMHQVFRRQLPGAIRRASVILTVSEYGKREVMEHLGVAEQHIRVTPNGVGPEFRPLSAERRREVLLEHTGGAPYILCVGTLEPRKNVSSLIEAYDLLRQRRRGFAHKLMLVGRWGWMVDAIRSALADAAFRRDILVKDYVAPHDLRELYAAADLFVFPSFYEGFGLPVLEAMASGVPVIAAGTSSIPEVLGDAGVTINPATALEQLVEVIPLTLEDEERRRRMVRSGLERAATFTWRRTAELTLAAYEIAAA